MGNATLKLDNGCVHLAGELTFATVTGLFASMQAAANKQGLPSRIDLAGVRKIDSSGLSLLLEWQSLYRKQEGSEARIDISHPPESLLKIARLCDAEAFLTDRSSKSENDASRQ